MLDRYPRSHCRAQDVATITLNKRLVQIAGRYADVRLLRTLQQSIIQVNDPRVLRVGREIVTGCCIRSAPGQNDPSYLRRQEADTFSAPRRINSRDRGRVRRKFPSEGHYAHQQRNDSFHTASVQVARPPHHNGDAIEWVTIRRSTAASAKRSQASSTRMPSLIFSAAPPITTCGPGTMRAWIASKVSLTWA